MKINLLKNYQHTLSTTVNIALYVSIVSEFYCIYTLHDNFLCTASIFMCFELIALYAHCHVCVSS